MSKKLFSIHAHACVCVCVEKVIDIWERRTGKRTELAESQVTCSFADLLLCPGYWARCHGRERNPPKLCARWGVGGCMLVCGV